LVLNNPLPTDLFPDRFGMNENKLKFSVDTERLVKLGPNFLQSKVGQNALVAGSLKGEDRLFIALASSSLLNTTLFVPGKK
jgi:hypothetical protein